MARRARLVALIAVMVAGSAIAWFLASSRDDATPRIERSPQHPSDGDATAAASAPAAPAAIERAAEVAATNADPVAEAEHLAREIGLELAEARADGRSILAVEAGTGKPLPGTLLVVSEYRPSGRFSRKAPPPASPHRLLFLRNYGSAARGTTYVTGPDGRARLRKLVANSLVLAYHPRFDGWVWVRDDRVDEIRLEMEPTKWLHVRVVDASGRPRAKVPIEVTRFTAKREPVARGFETDAEGLAELHPFQLRPPRSAADLVRVGLALPLADDVAVQIDPARIPDEPIELGPPPTGTLAVSVVDSAGEPVPDAEVVYDAGIADPADPKAADVIQHDPRRRASIPFEEGEGELGSVGRGLTFVLSASAFGRFAPPKSLPDRSPTESASSASSSCPTRSRGSPGGSSIPTRRPS